MLYRVTDKSHVLLPLFHCSVLESCSGYYCLYLCNVFMVNLFSVPPVFSKLPQNKTIEFGEAASISCDASSGSKVTILKDGRAFTPKDTTSRLFVFQTSIFIREVRYSDSGVFTCQATNKAGTTTVHARLRVLGKKIPRESHFIHSMLLLLRKESKSII